MYKIVYDHNGKRQRKTFACEHDLDCYLIALDLMSAQDEIRVVQVVLNGNVKG